MGASIAQIVNLITKDFLLLIPLAFVISLPNTWFIVDRWLQGFAYRFESTWQSLGFACGISLLIAFITISYQAIKAALANPVESLRSE